jgi:hypothetical protein
MSNSDYYKEFFSSSLEKILRINMTYIETLSLKQIYLVKKEEINGCSDQSLIFNKNLYFNREEIWGTIVKSNDIRDSCKVDVRMFNDNNKWNIID